MQALRNKKILLGICGSIAAYKAAFLVRLLVKEEAEVKVIMTTSASEFITPLTLSTLSKNPVYSEFVKDDGTGQWNNHVELALWADVLLIAPASANTIAKLAHGFCDNLLAAAYLSAKCPVFVAPAMDLDMYKHPASRQNIEKLQKFGNHIIAAEHGELASGLTGQGRMAEPENIVKLLNQHFTDSKKLLGKKALVTAGPTYEPLDPVRFIGNTSTGKMGYALAETLQEYGAQVTLISGPSQLNPPAGVELLKVNTAAQMRDKTLEHFASSDIILLAAAVADYTPKEVSESKLKKKEQEFNLTLIKTADIALEAGKLKKNGQVMVGFALETDHELENAKAKREAKNFDFIVLNSLKDEGAGFGYDTNKITIIDKNNKTTNFELKNKKEVARDIVQTIIAQNP